MSTENISANVIEAHRISVVNDGAEPGTLVVNGVNVADKIDQNALKCQTLENKINLHSADISTSTPPSRFHLTTNDINKINSVSLKANQSDLNLLQTTVANISTTLGSKAEISAVDELAEKCVTYRINESDNHKLIELENLVFYNHDLTLENAKLVMQNNDIVLFNHCSNIVGHESKITIKDVEVNNIVEVTGTGVTENLGDVTIERNAEKYSVWEHLTNNVKHITQEERDKWNAIVDPNIFFIADADSTGHPNVENPNNTVIYLVKDDESTDVENYYKKWAWVEHIPGSGDYQWEKMGSASIDLSEYATKEQLNAHTVNTTIHISTPEQINAVNSGITGEKVANYDAYRAEIDILKSPHFILVDELPETGLINFIYLVPKTDPVEKNIKEEYIWVETETDAHWEKIGDTAIDLSNYATKDELAAHTTNSDIHVTLAKKTEWDSKISAINLNNSTNTDIVDTSTVISGNTISHNFALNKVVASSSIATGEARVPSAGAVADYVNATAGNYVSKTGDTMSGQLEFTHTDTAAIVLPFDSGLEGGHIIFGGSMAGRLESTDISSAAVTLNTSNSTVQNGLNSAMLSSTGLMLTVLTPTSEDPVSFTFIDNDGNIMASSSVSTITATANEVKTNILSPAVQTPANEILVKSNLRLYGSSNCLYTNIIQPTSANKVLFTTFNGEMDVTVSGTSKMGSIAPIVRIISGEDDADVLISGESVYGHIKNPHLHLTDDQVNVLSAAEKGCFIFKPTDPDPTHPDEPYKGVNPKLILKNTEDEPNGYREATLQVDYDIGSSLELKKDDNAYTAILSNGNHTTGSKLQINDNGVLIASSYNGPATITPNARTTIMGDTSIGDSTTNYTFTVNGKDIAGSAIDFEEHVNDKSIHVNALQKAALDEKQTDDYTNKTQSVSQFGNAISAGAIDRAFVGTKNIIASLTLKTAGDGAKPDDERKLAIYACNASTLPGRIADNGKLADTTTCRFIGLSSDTNVISSYNTEYTWHFDNLELDDNDKFIIFSIVDKNAVLNADDFKYTNVKILTLAQRANEKSVVYGPSFGENNHVPHYEIGLFDGYVIKNVVKDYKDGKPLLNPSSDITLINESVFNTANSPIAIIPAAITDKLIKSTILFKPSTDVQVVDLFNENVVDKVLCHDSTLVANKLSIIEITQVNTRRNKLHNSRYYIKYKIKKERFNRSFFISTNNNKNYFVLSINEKKHAAAFISGSMTSGNFEI